jgi:hypothetical protein
VVEGILREREFDREDKNDKQRVAALKEKLKAKNEVLSQLMEEHMTLKRVLGSFKGHLRASRHPGCDYRFRPSLVWEDGDCRGAVHPLAGGFGQ